MWLLRAVKGWISIHHRSFSVALHLSVGFRQTVCQEYANFGVLLEEVGMQVRIRTNSLECEFAPNSHEFVDHSELEFATSNSNPP